MKSSNKMATSGKCFYFFLTFIWIFLSGYNINAHTCNHAVPKRHEILHTAHSGEPAHIIRKRSLNQRLRIHLHYDSSLGPDRLRVVKEVYMPETVSYLEEAFSVRHTVGPIKLSPQCASDRVRYKDGDPHPYCVDGCANQTFCGHTIVPSDHLDACRIAPVGESHSLKGKSGPGVVNADFILYVSAKKTDRCDMGSSTSAYASYCQLEEALDRPVVGYFNICPDKITSRPHDVDQWISTLRHEALHALGFSAGLYAFYRDDNGEPLTPRFNSTGKPDFNERLQMYQWSNKVIKKVTRPDWKVKDGVIDKEVTMIVTPRVVKEVRRHFNCSTLEGAEVEDQGISGTQLTHWEKRIFENEVMTGTYTQNPILSRITLALMEDTGWYKANYDKAEPLLWGKNLGCDFVKKSCHEWMSERMNRNEHVHPYCNRVKQNELETECTEDRDAVALCNLVEFTAELPPEYRHFSQLPGVHHRALNRFGGSVVLADYCPYIQEFNWKNGEDVVRGSKCGLHVNNADPEINFTLEKYGNRSKCFDHKYPWRIKRCTHSLQVEHWGSGCYQYECSSETGLSIVIGTERYRCFRPGQVLLVKQVSGPWLHEGSLECPSCEELCADKGVVCPSEVNPPERLEVISMDIEVPCSSANNRLSHILYVLLIFSTLLRQVRIRVL